MTLENAKCWHALMTKEMPKSDDRKWWHKVMTQSGDTKWCHKAMTQSDDTIWWQKLREQIDDIKWWQNVNNTKWCLKRRKGNKTKW